MRKCKRKYSFIINTSLSIFLILGSNSAGSFVIFEVVISSTEYFTQNSRGILVNYKTNDVYLYEIIE